ncbi:hypothetical protein BH18ACT9_BH18ACT9_18350 [soil metagenome]
MSPTGDEDSPWTRPVLAGIGALVAVSLLVGGVVGVAALGAVKLTGIGQTRSATTVAPSLYIPSGRPTTRPQGYPEPSGDEGSATGEQSATADPSSKRRRPPITLQVVPAQANSGERVDLSGRYPRGEGATLQVQRFEAGWVDFPVTASVSAGAYHTYIYTERVGESRLRMLDKASGRVSNTATLTIG